MLRPRSRLSRFDSSLTQGWIGAAWLSRSSARAACRPRGRFPRPDSRCDQVAQGGGLIGVVPKYLVVPSAASAHQRKRPPTDGVEAASLLQPVTVPCVLDLEEGDHRDGRQHDRSGQYRHERKHFVSGAAVDRAMRASHPHARRFQLGAPFVSSRRARGRAGATAPLLSIVRRAARCDLVAAAWVGWFGCEA